jgi:hypothetical protein
MRVTVGLGLVEILVVAAVVAAIFAVARLLWPPGRRTGLASEPACGRCGYNTTGLASLRCPECGSDLRAVGIVTPATPPRRVYFATAAPLFSALWFFSALLASSVVERVVPAPRRCTVLTGLDQPHSGAYAGVDVYANGMAWGDERPAMSVGLSLRSRPGAQLRGIGALKVDPEAGSYSYLDTTPKNVSAASGFSGEVVKQWLAAAGVDTSDPRVRAEANRIAAAARRAGRRPATVTDLAGSSRSVGNDPHFIAISRSVSLAPVRLTWLPIPLLAAGVAVWLAGLAYLWQMTRDPTSGA